MRAGRRFATLAPMTGLEQDISTFWTLLFDIITDAEQRLAAHMAHHNLTPPQFFVLKTLVNHEGHCPIGQIAREHHLSRATMTGLVQRLESAGLVSRRRNLEDGRSVSVELTPDGQQRFEAVRDDVFDQLQALLGMVNDSERQALMFFLSRYLELVNQLSPGPAAPDTSLQDGQHGGG
ncbi:MAG: MarR family transcriptional regulator [Anaerolineae bacterium]|nr:MarR family transcriptional regulator [Anaerolineae bacterium]